MRRLGSTVIGAGANLLAQGVPFLLLLFVTPILVRSLGREVYGALILFNLVPQIASQVDLGLITAGTRAYAQLTAQGGTREARRVIGETLAILCIWGVLLAACMIVWRAPIARVLQLDDVLHGDLFVFAIAAIGIPLALINGAALIPLRAIEQYGRAASIQIVAGITYWTTCAVCAAYGTSLIILVAVGTATVACTTIALVIFIVFRSARLSSPPIDALATSNVLASLAVDDLTPTIAKSTLRLRPYLSLGAGAFVAQASSLATYHTDKFLVSALISPAAAGAYAICSNIANKILLVVASGATYTFPRAARLHAQGDQDALIRTFVVTTRFVMMVAVAFAIPLGALAPAFLQIWIGADFSEHYASIMQWLVVGYAINASSVVASNVAIGIGQVRLPATFAVVGGGTTIVAVALLAPPLGAVGAAIAATIGMSQAMIFNALIAGELGAGARQASWPLALQLAAVAVPVAFVTASAGSWVTGWLSLFAVGAVSMTLFLLSWLLTFGRHVERVLIATLIARARQQPARA